MKHASTAMKALALSFALSLAPINGAWAQGNAVKGTVVGDDGPVIGATIRVKVYLTWLQLPTLTVTSLSTPRKVPPCKSPI